MSFIHLHALHDLLEPITSAPGQEAIYGSGGSVGRWDSGVATQDFLFSRDLSSSDHLLQPLSGLEEQRLRALDRKAKGGWLTVQEDREFEQLLAIRRYHQIRRSQPRWTHQQVLRALRGVA